MDDQPDSDAAGPLGRRRVLQLGAVAASMVVTVRPALAQATGSILNCRIPVPAKTDGASYISAEGKLVAPGTAGAFPPAPREFTGEEVKRALRGGSLPGTSYQQSDAYLRYIRRLQSGQSGFTCYASLQMPR